MKKLLYITTVLLTIMACNKEEEQAFTVNIDAELQPYIDQFVSEGLERGVEVDFRTEGLSAKILTIATTGIAGHCIEFDERNDELTIDAEFWDIYSEDQRELLVFHELGHCYLDLGHDDRKDAAGTCLSIMHSSNSVCDVVFLDEKREELLDELFNK